MYVLRVRVSEGGRYLLTCLSYLLADWLAGWREATFSCSSSLVVLRLASLSVRVRERFTIVWNKGCQHVCVPANVCVPPVEISWFVLSFVDEKKLNQIKLLLT